MKTSSNNLSDSPHSGFFPSLFTITMDSFQVCLLTEIVMTTSSNNLGGELARLYKGTMSWRSATFNVNGGKTVQGDVHNVSLRWIPSRKKSVAGVLKHKSKPSWEDALVQLQRSIPVNIPRVTKNVYQPLKLNYDQLESDDIRQKLSQNADMKRHMAISIAAEGKHALMVCHDVDLESSPLGFDTSQA
ncbi:hypothetical protein BC332_01537 [Capsicum chinense]|nr:hypothetical protein BC332_01537 [Capsicum chinense]